MFVCTERKGTKADTGTVSFQKVYFYTLFTVHTDKVFSA